MKDKEPESARKNAPDTREPSAYIEKPRVYRDRTKKRRLLPEEKVNTDEIKPRKEPYRRKKDWVNQTDEE